MKIKHSEEKANNKSSKSNIIKTTTDRHNEIQINETKILVILK